VIAVLRLGGGADGQRYRIQSFVAARTCTSPPSPPTRRHRRSCSPMWWPGSWVSRQKIVVHILMDYAPLADSAE